MARVIKHLCLVVSLIFSVHVYSATQIIDGSGQLLGATDVDVNGVLYNVEFKADSFANIFGDMSSLILVADNNAAEDFARALLNQVLINTTEGSFDTDPELTFGCTAITSCAIHTPLQIATSPGFWYRAIAINGTAITSGSRPDSTNVLGQLDVNQVLSVSNVYAEWTVATVPVPAAAWLFGSSLLGLMTFQRGKK